MNLTEPYFLKPLTLKLKNFDVIGANEKDLENKIEECILTIHLERTNQFCTFLKSLGYEIKTPQAYNQFMMNRCKIKHYPNQMVQFSVDDHIIAQGFDNYQAHLEADKITFELGYPGIKTEA